MSRLLARIAIRLIGRHIAYVAEKAYYRGLEDGRIFGKERSIADLFNDEYWLDRLNGTRRLSVKWMRECITGEWSNK